VTEPLHQRRQHRSSINWLVHRIHDAALADRLARHARGTLLDVGCGEKPYAPLVAPYVDRHIGLDHPDTQHPTGAVDVYAVAYETGLADASMDTVLCTFVLEHLEEPGRALEEMARVLKPGGHLILSAPQYWHLHEEPRDFYRYTRHGLTHLLEAAGLDVVEVTPLAGFTVTFFQEAAYFVRPTERRLSWLPRKLAAAAFLRLGWWAHRWDRSYRYAWAHMAVARKP
jgi:ubiquinone/menaquinone biosynthesis C-methylase UbiE